MTEENGSRPPIALSGLPAAYGRTIFGGAAPAMIGNPMGQPTIPGTNQACPCSVGRFCPFHSKGQGENAKAGTAGARYIPVAGTRATEINPHEQLAQLVAGFLDGLISQVAARVVRELEPALALFSSILHLQRGGPGPTLHEELREFLLCPRCSSGECPLNDLRKVISPLCMIVEGNNDWAWAHWAAHGCAMRVAIDSRLFYIDRPFLGAVNAANEHFVITEITDGSTDASPSYSTTSADDIEDIVRLMAGGLAFADAIAFDDD
jgi:hypothetical protein